ncbi:MAG TPA: protein kinase [Planctomycetota bacterium]|nr:protein kinase [Planctomycetota bacterium]
MSYTTDGLVGKLALQKGKITPDQLKDCLSEQAAFQKAGHKRPLGVIMVSRGLMTDGDLLDLLEEQKRVLAERSNYAQIRKDDFLFGQILLKQGVAASGEINEALRLQAEAAERGETAVPRLGQILIEMGVTEEKEIQRTLKLQYKTLYECPGCTLKYNLVDASGDKQYRCKKCDAVLVAKPPGTGIRADESAYGLNLEISDDLPAEVAQAELDPGNQFGKYILVRPLGRGGSGVVHLAYQKELKRFVALKLLRNDDPETLQRFTHEAQLAARLKHPNIVSVYEIGKHHNVSYIALEYVDGASLDQKGKLPVRRACQIIRDVAAAIHAAHEWGVIHRDLKPQNILLDRKDRAIVTDFGLAREVSAAKDLTERGIVVGTPAYMSVEQATGERALDGRSDVASLGAVLYELLTDRQPYVGRSPVDVALAVLNQTPPRPRELVPELPAAVEAICLKAMSKLREDRYQTAKALAEDLQRFLEGEAVHARPQGKISATVRRLGKNKTSTLAIVAAAALLCLAGMAVLAAQRDSRLAALLLEARTREAAGQLWEALRIYEEIPAARTDAERLREDLRRREAAAKQQQDRENAAVVLAQIGGDPSAAERVAIATRALEICSDFEQAYVIRALARQDLGDDASAYDDLGRAIQASSSPLPHLLSRAEIARRLGRVEDEILDLTAALDLTPFSGDLRVHRAWACAKAARKLAGSGKPDSRERAENFLKKAQSDLASVKRHSLLETVQGAVKEAHDAIQRGS